MKEKIGMYGGKFMPMHKGHEHCIDVAAKYCDKLYVVLVIHGTDEERIMNEHPDDEYLKPYARYLRLIEVCKKYPNAIPLVLNVANCRDENGNEDWDMETPLMRDFIPRMDYVFSSEVAYGEYWERAYPEAQHILVDVNRDEFPISGTKCRAMAQKEREQWMV